MPPAEQSPSPAEALAEYAAKRDFSRTPEPSGAELTAPQPEAALRFAVQAHSARRMHFDLRLELDGVLKSWAVPNGISAAPGDRRLAVMTEDHPFLYLSFEGVIPKGNYGAGEMIVWDRGTYYPYEDGQTEPGTRDEAAARMRLGLTKGRLKIAFAGEKVRGNWNLVRTRGERDWLLIRRSEGPSAGRLDDPRSVISGLSLDDLKAGRRPVAGAPPPDRLASVPGARQAPFPAEVEPMMAAAAERPFSNPEWIFEPKLDGFRVLAHVLDGQCKMTSRRGLDNSREYAALCDELVTQPSRRMILDGEVVALDQDGRPTFAALQARLGEIKKHKLKSLAAQYPLTYYVFDILYLDGYDLRGVALAQRKELLRDAIVPTASIKLMEHFEVDGSVAYEAVRAMGLEGLVGKAKRSHYESGRRSPLWLKIKSTLDDEFVVGGYTKGNGARADTIGALLVGQYDQDGVLHYLGHVGSGFDERTAADFRRRLDGILTDARPFHEPVVPNATPVWVRPELVVQVSYQGFGADGHLRFPVFVRRRDDRVAAEARAVEVVAPPSPEATMDSVAAVLAQLETTAKSLSLEVEGQKLSLTNLDKHLWPNATKGDLIRYLARVSPYMLPHLRDRPLTLIRYPDGIHGGLFYQKHLPAKRPEFVDTVKLFSDHNDGDEELPICNNLATLLWLGQMGVLEIHSQYARVTPGPDNASGHLSFTGSVENVRGSLISYPDYVVFDLDPVRPNAADAPAFDRARFMKVAQAAHWLRELLDTLSLAAFVKTTGRSGLHLFVPIKRQLDYEATRSISHTIAQFLWRAHPREITAEFAIARRKGDVFVDWNQNVRGKTLTSIYSPRATAEATVSMPLRWDEVGKLTPLDLTIHTAPDRLKQTGDIWASVMAAKADLAAQLGALAPA